MPHTTANAPCSANYADVIAQLRAKVRSRMDGITASSMRQQGVHYSYNWGLSIPQVRELAHDLPQQRSLAEQLLATQSRELRLIGLMVYPPQELTQERAIALAKTLETEELQNIYCNHLLAGAYHLAALPHGDLSLPIERCWLRAETRRLILDTPSQELVAWVSQTLHRLSSDASPDQLSTVEINFLERAYNHPLSHSLVRTAFEEWQERPETDALHHIATYIESLY